MCNDMVIASVYSLVISKTGPQKMVYSFLSINFYQADQTVSGWQEDK